MINLIQLGANWLAGVQQSFVATSVTYRRGGNSGPSVRLTATVDESSEQVETAEGLLVESKMRDYFIFVTDLVLSGNPTTPQQADEIVETDGTVFQVVPKPNVGVWEWWDLGRTRYVVHTKQVGAES